MLVYGATGKAGNLVVERALSEGWTVAAFVRNPDKVPEALKSKVKIIQGDLNNAETIKSAVQSTRPNAIVDASSVLPFGHAKGQPANNADRGILVKATVEALESGGRLNDCVLLIVGGQLLPEPNGKINSWPVWGLAMLLKHVIARSMWRGAEESVRWMFEDTPREFRFIYARMGHMVVAPSAGRLQPEPTLNNIQHGKASFVDVATAFVQLAGDESRKWERQAIYFNYVNDKSTESQH